MTTNGNLQTIQTKEIFPAESESNQVYGTLSILNYLTGAGESIPPWWSYGRDIALRNFVKNSDHLAGTVNTLRDMLVAIPFQVLPRDAGVKSHVRQADRFTEMMLDRGESRSNFSGIGWGAMYGPASEDYHVQDNGLIIAIDGQGESDGPVIGMPTRLIHLDSSRCLRTNSREYPIVYTDYDSKRYRLHYTRVIVMSSMSSPIAEMHGVGFCAVSRCINIVQNLMDISRYKQEKLGSRPARGLLHIAGGGQREVSALDALLTKYGFMQDNAGFTRYGKIPIYGSTGSLNLIDFASLPDGFNEMESTQLGMAVLALAFGVDSRQLAFSMGVSGQTKADAQVQHLKMQGKGPGLFIREFERQINAKLLPPHLMMVFDYQDDEQDAARADIRKVRAEARKIDIETGVTTVSIERSLMVENGELTRQQFERLEDETIEPPKPDETMPDETIDEIEETEMEDETKESDYASTQFNMPVWVTRLCAKIAATIDQSDIEEIEHDSHITLKYGLTHSDAIAIAAAIQDFDDLQLEFGNLTLFENETDVLKVDIVLSEELLKLYQSVSDTGSDDLYKGEYNPHLTIAYLKKGTGKKYIGLCELTGQKVTIDTVVFSSQDRTIVNIPLGQRVKSLATFTASIRASARGLFQQRLALSDFINSLNSAIERGYEQAWREGALECGISPDERTKEEWKELQGQIAEAKKHSFDFGEFIEDSRETGKFNDIAYRIDLWTNRYGELAGIAKTMACQDKKLKWTLGGRKSHCATCSRLAGRVMRASRWQELDIHPRDTRPGKLECNGYNCGCSLEVTTDRATSGRMPRL